jgi:hypothetical protein
MRDQEEESKVKKRIVQEANARASCGAAVLRPYTIVPALAVSGGGYGWREDATLRLTPRVW